MWTCLSDCGLSFARHIVPEACFGRVSITVGCYQCWHGGPNRIVHIRIIIRLLVTVFYSSHLLFSSLFVVFGVLFLNSVSLRQVKTEPICNRKMAYFTLTMKKFNQRMISIMCILSIISFPSTLCSQPMACPSKCSCLGALVDCSKRSLAEVPKDLPVWTEVL